MPDFDPVADATQAIFAADPAADPTAATGGAPPANAAKPGGRLADGVPASDGGRHTGENPAAAVASSNAAAGAGAGAGAGAADAAGAGAADADGGGETAADTGGTRLGNRPPGRRLRILTWHVHGNYLYNLTQVPHDFYLVTDAARSSHHSGRSGTLPWGDNVHEAPVDAIREMAFDVLMFQSRDAWDDEQHRILSAAQRRLPRIVIEHDPPQQSPTETLHWCQDAGALLVHVTHYNALMWDNGATPVRVVEHGVKPLAEPPWTGELARGIVVVNNLGSRGRRLGVDVWHEAAAQVPLRLVGMNSLQVGGSGEVSQHDLPAVLAAHRFFFNPIRHTSLGLAIVEAMLAGLPIVGLATTELVTVIENRRNGFIDTRVDRLVEAMRELLHDHGLAAEWGRAAQRTARERFGIGRFVDDWLRLLRDVAG